MPTAAPIDTIQSLRGLWSETLDRIDLRDIRSSVRPHELRWPTSAGSVSEPSPTGQRIVMPSPSEVGLEDIDGMRSGRERFMLGEMLGRGGMSVVLQATQRSLGRSVAVKVARYDLDPRQRERFRAESKLTAWLEHPNITPVYEAGRNYLVMRRIAGCDLERQVESGKLGLQRVVEVLLKVCEALSYAHHRGIIHRDIKPENILVGDFGEVMLIDWGLALSFSTPRDGTLRAPAVTGGSALCAGTPGYMAPEMALADAAGIGPATDVFLLGATLFRCLGGGIPFAAEDVWQALERSAMNDWTPVCAGAAPARLVALQSAAMSTKPADRPSLVEFQAGLRDWLLRSQSESEAQAALDGARRRLVEARGHRLQPHASYQDFVSCIAGCDRALTLNPDLSPAHAVREEAIADFILAAVGAGEMQLARLLKEGGRLPMAKVFETQGGTDDGSATAQRIGRLLPGAMQTSVNGLLRELVLRQREIERLAAENARLRTGYDAVAGDRDRLAGRLEASSARRRRRLCMALCVAAAVTVAWVLMKLL